GTTQKRVEGGCNADSVLRRRSSLTESPAGTVVDANFRVSSDGRRDPSPVCRGLGGARFHNHGGAAGAGAVQVEPVAANVNQLARHCSAGAVYRRSDRLVTATNGGQYQHAEHGIKEPPASVAVQLPPDCNDHPHDEGDDWERPQPADDTQGPGIWAKDD